MDKILAIEEHCLDKLRAIIRVITSWIILKF